MIGACGAEPGCSPGKVGKSYEIIVDCAADRDALVIPAHVNGPNGLLTVLQGQALINVWQNDAVHAVVVSPGIAVTSLHKRILDNREKEYQRQHPVAVLHADDICDPARFTTTGGSCWVKMSTPSLAALDLVEHNLDAPQLLEALNARIEDRDLAIGPSYLMLAGIYRHADGLDRVWETSILPLLAEHHYGSPPAILDRYRLPALRAALAAQHPTPEPPP